MKKSFALLTSSALALAVLASGCTMNKPAAVAEVAGEKITQAQVDSLATELVEAVKKQPQAAERDVKKTDLQYYIIRGLLWGKVGKKVADNKKIEIDAKTRELALNKARIPVIESEKFKDFNEGMGNYLGMVFQMEEKDFLAEVAKVDVKLNPRYGVWSDGSVKPMGVLSSPLPAAQN